MDQNMSISTSHIELTNVSKRYNSANGTSLDVLKNISLSLKKGETAAIHGPSGSGKSTLLNLIGGLDTPDTGTIHVAGKNLSGLSADALAQFRNQSVGFVFQLHHLLPQCTLRENILIPSIAGHQPSASIVTRANELMERLSIDTRANHYPSELSGGERLRAAVARSLMNDPEVLLANEPTGSLDEENAIKLTDLLLEINQSLNLTLLVVTHAQTIADRMQVAYRIRSGSLEKSR